MLRNLLASTTSIIAIWTAIVSAVPATPEQPPPGPDQFIVGRLSTTLNIFADATPFGFPQNVVLELQKIDSSWRPLVRYVCFKTVNTPEEWADKTLTCIPASEETTGPEEIGDPEERRQPITPGTFQRAAESNAAEEATFSVEMTAFESLLNFDLVFSRPSLPSQRSLVANISPDHWTFTVSEDGHRIISRWLAPRDELLFRDQGS